MHLSDEELEKVGRIVDLIRDKKGRDVRILDMRDHSVAASFFIIADGDNPKQVEAIANNIVDGLAEKPLHKEGLDQKKWIALDYEQVWVHIFMEETRDFYDLDGFWIDRTLSLDELSPAGAN